MKRPLAIQPQHTAALFVDLQEEHRTDKRYLVEGFDVVLANAARLQQAARQAGIAVVHAKYVVDSTVQPLRPFHPMMADGTSAFSDKTDPGVEICGEVGPLAGETVLVKHEASCFGTAILTETLRAKGIAWLLVAGVWTEACVDATVKHAVAQGFRVILVKNACGSGSAAMHQTAILNLANRLYGGAVADTDAACRLIAGETVEAWQIEGAVPLRYSYENAASIYDDL